MNKTKRTEAEQKELLAYLREKYDYDCDSGLLVNKRTRHPLRQLRWTNNKYVRIRPRVYGVKIDVAYHIAVWVVCKSYWPNGTIDHINGNPLDNRIENLRECSQSENHLNKELPWEPNPETGVPGVFLDKGSIITKIRGKRMCFSSPYEAFFHATMCGKRYRQRQETTLGIFSTMNHKNL